MTTEQTLLDRSDSKCELCASNNNLSVYAVPPSSDGSADQSVLLCATCLGQIENPETSDANHWRCLNDSMWTPVPAVQVMASRILNSIKSEGWPQDLLDTLYLEDDVQTWADADNNDSDDDDGEATLDSNGAKLSEGDSVTLIKDLVVKGANFTAKRGTMVKNISLTSNPKHIEGRVNGTRIVLVSAFLKKA
jgi:protein PhnA